MLTSLRTGELLRISVQLQLLDNFLSPDGVPFLSMSLVAAHREASALFAGFGSARALRLTMQAAQLQERQRGEISYWPR